MLGVVLLLLVVSCLVVDTNSIADQKTPSADSYIVAESNGGLANRLRALAAYLYLAEVYYHGIHTAFIWDKNSACPGHFLSLFEPVPKLIFATNSSRELVNQHALKVYNNTMNGFQYILKEHNMGAGESKLHYAYRQFVRPTRDIMTKVNEFVSQHNVCNMSAIHLRTTDLDKILNVKKRTNLRIAYSFLDKRPEGEKVFLLTDDPKTQQHIMEKYGDKIVVYHRIANETALGANASISLPEDHRYTSLEHTLIDVLVAAHARTFRAASFSSLSDLVWTFRGISTFCEL